jgi:hypothetical protein
MIGHGAKSALSGDEVWVLAGAKMPYILRPLGNDEHQLVGEVCVDGIMNGEVV